MFLIPSRKSNYGNQRRALQFCFGISSLFQSILKLFIFASIENSCSDPKFKFTINLLFKIKMFTSLLSKLRFKLGVTHSNLLKLNRVVAQNKTIYYQVIHIHLQQLLSDTSWSDASG